MQLLLLLLVLLLLPPPRSEYLWRDLFLLLFGYQIDALVTLDVDGESLIFKIILTRSLGQMNVNHALAQRTLDVEFEAQMIGAPLVCLLSAVDVAIAGPA
jgi:hypothetical protein